MSKTICRPVKRSTDLYPISRYFLGKWISLYSVLNFETVSGFQVSILESVERVLTGVVNPISPQWSDPELIWCLLPRTRMNVLDTKNCWVAKDCWRGEHVERTGPTNRERPKTLSWIVVDVVFLMADPLVVINTFIIHIGHNSVSGFWNLMSSQCWQSNYIRITYMWCAVKVTLASARLCRTAFPQWILDFKSYASTDSPTKQEQNKTHMQQHATWETGTYLKQVLTVFISSY